MKNTRVPSLNQVFKCIPMLAGYHPDEFKITQLTSYTNENYHLKNSSLDLILRLPRTQTNAYINRNAETYNQNIVFNLGLSPACLWHNDEGESLTQTIKTGHSPTSTDLTQIDIMHLVAEGLSQLHNSQKQFQGQVDLQSLLNRYFDLLDNRQQKKYHSRFTQALNRLKTMESEHDKLVPSHNDLNENNLLLDENNKLWMIDWEYSSMASPYWDLATICNSGQYEEIHCRHLLSAYKHEHNDLDDQTLQGYREILSVLNDCWMSAFNG
ncbi:MAG: phosphotransferase [Gammaproteobacteria bacterium]|nr:phosphotransferase [Gammaproteobacteria bacterium]